jgi:hypothetical protein
VDNFHSYAVLDAIYLGHLSMDSAMAVDIDEIVIADGRPTGGLSRYHLYRSAAGGSPATIDYAAPVATIPLGATTRRMAGLGHTAGQDYWYGLRRISDSGVEERNTHVRALVRLDEAGNLVPPMAAPCDVTANSRKDGAVIVGFTYRAAGDWPCPGAFDIFTDGGTGTLDLGTPLASIPCVPRKSEYETIVTPSALPAKFAVRPRVGGVSGPRRRNRSHSERQSWKR